MKYLVVGSGGREHAIAWRLLNDASAREVFAAPGNGGIDEKYRANIQADDFDGIARFSRDNKIDVVIIGPEGPLSNGIVDFLEKEKIHVFGPSRAAAQLEGSKLFAKMIMEKYRIPTCGYRSFSSRADLLKHIDTIRSYPIVIKLDGLAAGKGVGIPENRIEALEFINAMVGEKSSVFVEELVKGEEASILGISDGETVKMLISAQDHKRVFDGDRGPNTGGMGAYSPAPVMTGERLKRVYDDIMVPAVRGMKKEGIPFKGVIYAGIMISGEDISVLEFNARFGDPETQVILPLLNGKLGDIIQGSIHGRLDKIDFSFSNRHCITVVMASGGYPGDYERGKKIEGLENVSDNIIVFHAGTNNERAGIFTNGGRVLNVTGTGDSIQSARSLVYGEIGKISFIGAHFRKDIAYRALG